MDVNGVPADPTADAGQLRWRQVIRGGVAGGSARMGAVAFSLVATPIAINEAGSTTYGLFAALTSFATIMTVADFGVGNGVIRELAVTRADPGAPDEGPIISAAAGLLVILGLLVIAVGALAAWVVPWQSLLRAPPGSAPQIREAVLVVAVCTGFALPGALAQKIYLARQQATRAGLLAAVATALGSLMLMLAAYFGHHLTIMVAAQLGIPAAVGIAALLRLAASRAIYLNVRRTSFRLVKVLLKRGRLFGALQLVAIINFEIDNLVVARILGPNEVTVFSATARVYAVPIVLATMFFTPLWAAFADAVARRDMPWVSMAYRRSTRIAATGLVPLAAALALCSGPAIRVWTDHAVHPNQTLILALSIWLVVYAFNQPQAMLLNALHAERFQLRAAAANLVLNLTFSIIFTEQFGVSGPIWGTIVAQLACAVVPSMIYLRRVENGSARHMPTDLPARQ
ncbi:MAG TPA: lipopolysaccharide biosynthesis protein [Acidothermaceae bacterium]|jgi:O-antigen/teichoic acid export membrane protein